MTSFHPILVVISLFFLCILGVFLGHRLYPTKAGWLLITILFIPILFDDIVTLPLFYETSEIVVHIIYIFLNIISIISFSVQDSYTFLLSKKKRIIVFFAMLLYIFAIWLSFGVDRVASDESVGYNGFIKHRLTFKVHYENPAWRGLEIFPHEKMTPEDQKQHIEYCEIRFGVSDIAECNKKFRKQ